MPDATVEEVADRVFTYVQSDGGWWVNTTGFLGRGGEVLAVDACATERRTRALLSAIDATVGGPVRTLVNTHSHGDHTYGNALFAGSTIIGHERCRAGMLADTVLAHTPPVWHPAPQWGDVTIHPPTVTFADRLTVWVGDRPVELHYVGGPAHTEGDIVVWLPDEGVLFTGDMVFNGGTPLLISGSVSGYLDALDRVAGFGARILVPGHGRPCGPEVFESLRAYTRFVLQTAEEGQAAGLTPLQTARELDLGEFAELLDPERIVLNLHRAYGELTGAEVDIATAFADAVAYNGGPLRCCV